MDHGFWASIARPDPPIRADAYQIGFVKAVAWIAIGGVGLLIVFSLAMGQAQRLYSLVGYVVVGAGSLLLLHKGRERAAMVFFAWSMWVACTHTMFLINGTLNIGVSALYTMVILMACWLLGLRAGLLLALASALAVILVTFAPALGISYTRTIPQPPHFAMVALIVMIAAAAALGCFAALSLRNRVEGLERTQTELRFQLALHGLTEEMAKVGHWITDRDRDEVVWSASLSAMAGVPPQPPLTVEQSRQIVKIAPLDLMHAIRDRLDGKPEVFHFARQDGTQRWVRILMIRPPGGENSPARYFGVVQDITEQHDAKLALEELNAELEQRVSTRTSELNTMVGELEAFSYTVAHDLNAPLRTIQGFASMLESEAGSRLEDADRARITRIRDASRHMGQLIADLLVLSRVTKATLRDTPIDLSALARAVASELDARTPERSVTWRIEDGLAARGDTGLVRIALENLLGNAWKYSRNAQPSVIEVGAAALNGTPAFFVRDNGAGFDDAHAEGLFKPFKRLHSESEFEGTGVGLATVDRIVRRHGGTVWAESKPGLGATFHFTLPTTDRQTGKMEGQKNLS